MTADHWTFVIAAYGIAGVVLAGYWRRLVRQERTVRAGAARRRGRR